jgi:phosphatidylglycerophosphate synthase
MAVEFKGDRKKGGGVLWSAERKLIVALAPYVPKCIETYHLTLSSILWCALIVLFSYLTRYNIHWLWGVSFAIVLQYLSDCLDGEIGRERNTGLIKWGYFMDHFLDYIFLCSILFGYSLMLDNKYEPYLILSLVLFSAFMVNSYLLFAATNEFKIGYYGIGPTELRLLIIINNIFMIILGPTYIMPALPYILIAGTLFLIHTVYWSHKVIWKIDMDHKKEG